MAAHQLRGYPETMQRIRRKVTASSCEENKRKSYISVIVDGHRLERCRGEAFWILRVYSESNGVHDITVRVMCMYIDVFSNESSYR